MKTGKCLQKTVTSSAGSNHGLGKIKLAACVFEVYPRQVDT